MGALREAFPFPALMWPESAAFAGSSPLQSAGPHCASGATNSVGAFASLLRGWVWLDVSKGAHLEIHVHWPL